MRGVAEFCCAVVDLVEALGRLAALLLFAGVLLVAGLALGAVGLWFVWSAIRDLVGW